ncbi:MAG: hypothetical protein ACRDZ4_11110 [Egibacteraceae bacterium]
MSTIQMQGAAVETLDDDALLDLIERGLAVLGARPLDGAVEDATLAESVERLHRVETVVVAEKTPQVRKCQAARSLWPVQLAQASCSS